MVATPPQAEEGKRMRKLAYLLCSTLALAATPAVSADATAQVHAAIEHFKAMGAAPDAEGIRRAAGSLRQTAEALAEAADAPGVRAGSPTQATIQVAAQNLHAAAAAATAGDLGAMLAILQISQAVIAAGLQTAGSTGAAASAALLSGIGVALPDGAGPAADEWSPVAGQ